jgi:aspartate carbamoyltransferase regulatory subunit
MSHRGQDDDVCEIHSVQHSVFLYGGMVCVNWECVQRKEQTVVSSLRIAMNSDVWCTARGVGVGTLFF